MTVTDFETNTGYVKHLLQHRSGRPEWVGDNYTLLKPPRRAQARSTTPLWEASVNDSYTLRKPPRGTSSIVYSTALGSQNE